MKTSSLIRFLTIICADIGVYFILSINLKVNFKLKQYYVEIMVLIMSFENFCLHLPLTKLRVSSIYVYHHIEIWFQLSIIRVFFVFFDQNYFHFHFDSNNFNVFNLTNNQKER